MQESCDTTLKLTQSGFHKSATEHIFRNRDSSERIGNWAIELTEYVIDFEKRTAIKSQVLADLMVDWTEPSSYTEGTVIDTPWQICCDGAWGVSGAGAEQY
jgi:hypothetical protein